MRRETPLPRGPQWTGACWVILLAMVAGCTRQSTPAQQPSKEEPLLTIEGKRQACTVELLDTAPAERRYRVMKRLEVAAVVGTAGADDEARRAALRERGCELGVHAVLVEPERPNVALYISFVHQRQPRSDAPAPLVGTCFAVSPTGHIVTAAHVVQDARDILVHFEGKDPLPARVVKRHHGNDVAWLTIDAAPPGYLSLSSSDTVEPGDEVFTFGFPVVELLGREAKFTDGTISALSGIQGEQRVMQITVPVQPGNSGGPVVTHEGLVVGVVTSSASAFKFFRATGSLPQGINWAVKAEHAMALFGQLPPVQRAKSRREAIALARRAVCAVAAK